MKAITKLILISIMMLLVMGCATTPYKLAEKYNFDSELEEVREIWNFRINSWESIDYQSLILRTDVNGYYLLVLQRPALNLPFSEDIGITLTIDRVWSRYDNIVVADSLGVESYIIEKIYKLKDNKQAKEIRERLNKTI